MGQEIGNDISSDIMRLYPSPAGNDINFSSMMNMTRDLSISNEALFRAIESLSAFTLAGKLKHVE